MGNQTTLGTTELAEGLMSTVGGLRRVVQRRLRKALPEPRLPAGQVELLVLVEGEPGIGVAAAARALGLAGNSVSGLVNTLVDGQWLRRETDPVDRRAARLYLTSRAKQRLVRRRDARAELVGAAIDRLDEADQRALGAAVPALRRLLDAVRDEEDT